ncbi:MAG TPA: SpoIIE family protein phosphatase [Acidimicrobiales bacterium]|nr:SpoIIE family protein phosphatase [Acidimicrobiales bacterium]
MVGPWPPDGDAVREVLDNLPLAVTVIDGDGLLAYVNHAAAELFGTTRDQLIGGSAVALTVAASDSTAAIELAANVAVGQPWMGRFPLTGPDGRRIDAWFASSRIAGNLVSIGGEAEAVERSLGVAEPDLVTQQSRTEAEEANRLLTTLLDAVPVAMGFLDRDLRFVRVNRTLAELNGSTPEAHVGLRLDDVFRAAPSVVREAIEHGFDSAETTAGMLVSAEVASKPSEERHWILSLFPVLLRGRVAWVGATAVDVTEWRRGEQERARLLEAEKAAREAAEDAAQRLARLQVVTARLAEATDIERVADIVLTQGAAGLGATAAGLLIAVGEGEDLKLQLIRSSGFAADAVASYSTIGIDDDVPLAEAVRSRDLLVIPNRAERDRRWPALREVTTWSQTSVALPLILDDRVIGAIALGWSIERVFSQSDRDFLVALGRQCVLALERVWLYEAERSARARAEEAIDRMAFLAEASRVLAASLDYNETLPRLARFAVREIADVCSIHLLDGGGFRLAGAAHRLPEKEPALVAAASRIDGTPRLLGRVVASGVATVIDDVTPEEIRRMAHDEEHERQLRALDLRSLVVVPLVLSGRVLGVLALGSSSEERRYRDDDLVFVQDVAARVAVAIENSLVHEARTEVARTLQQTLLPPVEPEIPGLDIAQRYHSAGEIDVGGDFFDVFPSGDGRWGVVMGDVCGRGVAAASLTALARYTVRAGAIDQGDPAQVLHLLNKAILDADAGERFCTIAHAVIEPLPTGAHMTLACGGHPLPLLLRASGDVEEIGTPGSAIGLFEELDLEEVEVELAPGDAVAFFTDGFTEARAPDGRFAPHLLEAALAGAAGGTAEQLAEAVDRAVLAFEGGRPRDDMALLVLRVPSAASLPRR